MKVILIYRGDCWLTRSSFELRCVATEGQDLPKILKKIFKDDSIPKKEWEERIRQCLSMNQTQGYEENYNLEKIDTDTIL